MSCFFVFELFEEKRKKIKNFKQEIFYKILQYNIIFKEPILQTYQTKYQNIVLTKRWDDLRMFLNWNIQFNSLDEHRYHEAWWDWLAVRNLLKHDFIKKITLVELDPEMIKISKTQKDLVKLNKNSFNNPKVNIIIWDAFKLLNL